MKNHITDEARSRLRQSLFQFVLHWLFPVRKVEIPELPNGITAHDHITMSTRFPMSFKDRVRALFCGDVNVSVVMACRQSPKLVQSNGVVYFLPPCQPKLKAPPVKNQPPPGAAQ